MRAILSIVFLAGGAAVSWPVAPGAAGAATVELKPLAATAGKYEKIEFSLQVDKTYSNPFDPDEVALDLEITTPGGRSLVLPAFWHQPFERERLGRGRPVDWMYPAGEAGWRARFASAEAGPHTAVARIKDRDGTARSKPVRFEVKPSVRSGFLRTSAKDPRFLEFSEGRPFFAIGQNLAFIGPGQYVTLAKAESILGELHANGANFLRVWTCCQDWALAVEARKSVWTRSWGGKPPFVPMPGQEKDPSVGRGARTEDRRGSPTPPKPSTEGHPPAPKAISELRCAQLGGGQPASVDLQTPNPLAVRPKTRYALSARLRIEGAASLRITAGSIAVGEPIRLDKEKTWTDLRREFQTGPDQRFLDRITLRVEGGTAWIDGLSLTEAGGGPELLWEAAINRPERGFYNPTDCFMLDQLLEAAEREGVYLQLCLVTRDLYMKSLEKDTSEEYAQAIRDCKKLLRYAVARWGYSTSMAAWEYFNEINPGLPTDRFYDELGNCLAEIDPYRHPRTTSAWSPSPKDWRLASLDWAQTHHYLRPADKDRARDEVAVVLERTRLMRQHAPRKPVMLGEFGLAEDNWQRSRWMQDDKELVHFHNALWASALSGASSTAMFWWWETLDQMGAYREYRPLSAFLADVPWTTGELGEATAEVRGATVRVVGLSGKACAYLWLSDPQATWHAAVVEKKKPGEIRGATLEVGGLAPGKYRVTWWDTREGKALSEETAEARDGPVRLSVPAFTRDVACKVESTGEPHPPNKR